MRVRRIHTLVLGAGLLATLWAAAPAGAQPSGQKPALLETIGMDEHLGASIPSDVVFRDSDGRAVALGSYFDGTTPVILNLVYHDCPMLCNVLLDKFTRSMQEMAWVAGDQFEVLTVSFNAIETPELARRQKERYLMTLGKPEAASGWHFLTGDTTAVNALTHAVGFKAQWLDDQQEFAHPATLIFLSGDGRIMRYLYGLEFPAGDIRTALVEASEGRIGTTLDQIILYCVRYDPRANSYVPHAVNLMKIGGLLTLLALGATLFVFWRREGRPIDEPPDAWSLAAGDAPDVR